MKKPLCLLLIALTLASLAACGGGNGKETAAAGRPAGAQSPRTSASQKPPSARDLAPGASASRPAQNTDGPDAAAGRPANAPALKLPAPKQAPPTEEPVRETAAEPAQSADDIDVDLTALSATMAYSEVYNILYSPDDYLGKVIKMHGRFSIYQAVDENGALIPDRIYFTCVMADAAACCAQGLEFVLTGEKLYPDDYPELGSEITVRGTFSLYEMDGFQYYRLAEAEMLE